MRTHSLGIVLTVGLLLAACSFIPQPLRAPGQSSSGPSLIGVKTQQASVRSEEATAQMVTFPNLVVLQALEQTRSTPNVPQNQMQQLDFVTGTPNTHQIKMPMNGQFQLIAVAGTSFQILDNDATDGIAKIQLPSQTFDLYLRPEALQTTASSCLTSPPPTALGTQLLDQLDQTVLSKSNQLVAAGQGACIYLPPSNQRQNANCNTTTTGVQCSGPLNKTLSSVSCPEMAIYAGAMNINDALPNSKLFVAMQNNLTINQSVKGIFSSRGDLNTNLNNSSHISGVFVGARSNNLNLSGSAKIQGLYTILNQGSLSMNLNPSAVFEGELCTTGTANINRNGNSQLIYNPNQVTPWQSDLSLVPGMMCASGSKPYTQTVAMTCPTPPPVTNGSVKIEDGLYYINQTLNSASDGHWFKLPGRPMPVPDDWHSDDHNQYILNLTNNGLPKISTRWLNIDQTIFPPGIKEIGPEGGIVALPGVGKIDIPSGALEIKTTISLKQVLEAPEILTQNSWTREMYREMDFASPILKVNPSGTKLNQEATVYLETDKTRLGNNHPGVLEWEISLDAKKWWKLDLKKPLPNSLDFDAWPDSLPATTPYLGIFAKFIPSDIHPNDKIRILVSNSRDFQIQDLATAHFYIEYPQTNQGLSDAQDRANELEMAYATYQALGRTVGMPTPTHSKELSLGRVVIFHLKPSLGAAFVSIGVKSVKH